MYDLDIIIFGIIASVLFVCVSFLFVIFLTEYEYCSALGKGISVYQADLDTQTEFSSGLKLI